ncbi:hypothetical protein SALBM217S_04365 [Streptomyces griseoloalbus]
MYSSPLRRRSARSTGSSRAPTAPRPWPGCSGPAGDALHTAVLTALRSLARRVKELTAEHEALTRALDAEVTTHNPGLRATYGVGPDTAAQLLITAGGNPERMQNRGVLRGSVRSRPGPRIQRPNQPSLPFPGR